MVKKSTFLEKLKSRLRASDVRVEAPDPAAKRGVADLETVAPRREVVDALSRRKLSGSEEATIALREGFAEIASLLRGVQARVDAQADGATVLPALHQQQIDALQAIAARMERQNASSEALVERLSGLPSVLTEVREALDRAAATDERTAATVAEFQSNMDRIHDSMDRVVAESRRQAEAARDQADATRAVATGERERMGEVVESITLEQRRTAQWLEVAQRETAKDLRDAQSDQAARLSRLVEDGTKTSRAILILLSLVFVALTSLVFILASR
jgi:hypothetical protein